LLLTPLLTVRVSNFRQMWRRLQAAVLSGEFGAGWGIRTPDPVITNHVIAFWQA
jgi:hypothetical protein